MQRAVFNNIGQIFPLQEEENAPQERIHSMIKPAL